MMSTSIWTILESDFTGIFFSDPDCFCSIKPYSMTSGGHRGCQGAIWGSGDPASKYCKEMKYKVLDI